MATQQVGGIRVRAPASLGGGNASASYMHCTVLAVTDTTATVVDQLGTQRDIPVSRTMGKGIRPKKGENWIISSDFGGWSFVMSTNDAEGSNIVGPAGGDLSGSYPDPVVTTLGGVPVGTVTGAVTAVIPNAPTTIGLSSSMYTTDDQKLRLRGRATWLPPTQNTDGTPVLGLHHFEAAWQYTDVPTDTDWHKLPNASIDDIDPVDPTKVILTWIPLLRAKHVNFRVRAVDRFGNRSAWAATTALLQGAYGAPPAPSNPVLDLYLGFHRVYWDGKNFDGSAVPTDFKHIEVHWSTLNGFTPSGTTLVSTMAKSGYYVHKGNYSVTGYFIFVEVDEAGNSSAPSNQVGNTPVKVASVDVADSAIQTNHVADTAISTAKLGNAAVTDAKVNDVTATKLTSGNLAHTFVLTGSITTSSTGTGPRVESDNTGIRLYGSSSDVNPVVNLSTATGSGLFTGIITGSYFSTSTVNGDQNISISSTIPSSTTKQTISFNPGTTSFNAVGGVGTITPALIQQSTTDGSLQIIGSVYTGATGNKPTITLGGGSSSISIQASSLTDTILVYGTTFFYGVGGVTLRASMQSNGFFLNVPLNASVLTAKHVISTGGAIELDANNVNINPAVSGVTPGTTNVNLGPGTQLNIGGGQPYMNIFYEWVWNLNAPNLAAGADKMFPLNTLNITRGQMVYDFLDNTGWGYLTTTGFMVPFTGYWHIEFRVGFTNGGNGCSWGMYLQNDTDSIQIAWKTSSYALGSNFHDTLSFDGWLVSGKIITFHLVNNGTTTLTMNSTTNTGLKSNGGSIKYCI